MKATVICVGKLKEKWMRDACGEYLKRLGRFGSFDIEEVDDRPEGSRRSDAEDAAVLDKEGSDILKRIKPQDLVVCLAIKGKKYDSLEFSQKTEEWAMDPRPLVLVIGGSLGLSEAVYRRADEMISFSDMTFPHGLMRVILLEQLYRALKISHGEPYHK